MKLVENVNTYLVNRADTLAQLFVEKTIEELASETESSRMIVSPIEQIFLIEWRVQEHLRQTYFPFNLAPQYQDEKTTGKYFLDFAIEFMNDEADAFDLFGKKYPRPPLIGIELDGHDFHEKTKRQVEYHKERERFLISHGWTLLRYAGSEIIKDAESRVREALDFIWKKRNEYRASFLSAHKG
jgi:hypothetical protein